MDSTEKIKSIKKEIERLEKRREDDGNRICDLQERLERVGCGDAKAEYEKKYLGKFFKDSQENGEWNRYTAITKIVSVKADPFEVSGMETKFEMVSFYVPVNGIDGEHVLAVDHDLEASRDLGSLFDEKTVREITADEFAKAAADFGRMLAEAAGIKRNEK